MANKLYLSRPKTDLNPSNGLSRVAFGYSTQQRTTDAGV